MENTLYDVKNKFVQLMQEDELTEEQKHELEQDLQEELTNKSTNIIAYIVDSESLIERMKAEETRLKLLRTLAEQKLDKFKGYVKDNMNYMQIKDVQTELGKLSVAKNPISVEVIDENLVPDEYKVIKTTYSVDKKAISEHFKETGEVVEGTQMITNKTSLRIK